MPHHRWAIISIAVLGMATLGVGLGLHFTASSGITPPSGQPVVYAEQLYTMQGIWNTLYVYPDGTVINVIDTHIRGATKQNPAVRTWYEGSVSPAELAGLLAYFREIEFNTLEVPHLGTSEGAPPTPFSDLMYTVSVSSGDLQRSLTISDYFPPTYTGENKVMPPPFDAIYQRLSAIADGTKEVHREVLNE